MLDDGEWRNGAKTKLPIENLCFNHVDVSRGEKNVLVKEAYLLCHDRTASEEEAVYNQMCGVKTILWWKYCLNTYLNCSINSPMRLQNHFNRTEITLQNFNRFRKLNCLKKLIKGFFFKILRRIQWYKSLFIVCLDLRVRTISILRSKRRLETRPTKSK